MCLIPCLLSSVRRALHPGVVVTTILPDCIQTKGSHPVQIRSVLTATFNYTPLTAWLLRHLRSANTTAGTAVMRSGTQHSLVFHPLPPSSELALLRGFTASVSKTHQKPLHENDYQCHRNRLACSSLVWGCFNSLLFMTHL